MREFSGQRPFASMTDFSGQDATFVDILRWRALHQPEQRAYIFLADGEHEEVSVTYGQLDQSARAVAVRIQEYASPGQCALLLYPPGLNYIAAFLGCLYAGVVAVPAYPPSSDRSLGRIQSIAEDAQATLVLTTHQIVTKVEHWATLLPALSTMRWIATDDDCDVQISTWREPELTAETLTFLQYTSGSTGNPKGVMVSQRNLLHNSVMMCERWGHSAQSRGVSWLPMFHDMGLIAGILQPLYVGFPAILMTPTAFIQRPIRWLQAISKYQGTTSWAPNFAYELCLRRVTEEERGQLDLSSWKVAGNGAEPVRSETIDRFATYFASCGFRHEAITPGYGLAEGTLMVTSTPANVSPPTIYLDKLGLERRQVVEHPVSEKGALPFVGCGSWARDQRVVIVHPETMVECRQDEIGEIWVHGPSVTQGYWRRPDETRQTFQAFLAETGEGPFLRTGDLGFQRQGDLFIAGRLKDVIIVRGRNLYPHDIELTVEQSHSSLRPGCGAAFSIEVDGEEQLIIVQELLRNYLDTDAIFNEIRRAVVEQYDVYPYAIALIKYGSIFKTSSGKIQRRTCKEAFLQEKLSIIEKRVLEEKATTGVVESISRASLWAMDSAEQRTFLERYLAGRFSAILRLERSVIDVDTSMDAFGLDSLRAAELRTTIEDELGIALSFEDVLQDLSITSLTTRLLALLGEAVSPVISYELKKASFPLLEYPLSFSQEQLWILQRLEPDSSSYNIPVALHIKGKINVKALDESISALIVRQSALRTSIQIKGDRPVQRIATAPATKLVIIDMGDLPEHDVWLVEAQRQIQMEAQNAFDLLNDPLMRVSLLCWREEHLLLITMHHIISDARSVAIFLRELALLYTARSQNSQAQLPALPVQYTDYILWLHEKLQGEIVEKHFAYWMQQLDNLPTLHFPLDRARPAISRYRGATHSFVIPPALKKRYQALSNEEGVTLFMAFLTAFQILLARYAGQEEVVVGTVVANRSKTDVKDLVGFFINTLVLRSRLPSGGDFRAFLQHTRRICLDAYAHQDLPFARLVEQLQPERHLSRNPLFQYMFMWRDDELEDISIPGLVLSQFEVSNATTKFDLSLELVNGKQSLSGKIEYDIDLFDPETIERLGIHFCTLLEAIVSNPDQRLSRLPLLTREESQRILVEWNDTRDSRLASAADLPQLFETQAHLTPDALATVYEDQYLSYEKLDHYANQLAHFLRARGVGAESLVGVYLPRSPELLVALLAVLKAGGAYVPLDQTLPEERVCLLIHEAGMGIVLTVQALEQRLMDVESEQVLSLDLLWSQLAEEEVTPPFRMKDEQSLAYVIYTSGSTGVPKGVAVTHGGLSNYLQWARKCYRPEEGWGALLHSSIGFDLSVTSLYLPLLVGGMVVQVREEGGVEELVRQMRERGGSSLLKVTPSHLEVLNQVVPEGELGGVTGVVIVGGEALGRSRLRRWGEEGGGTRVVNEYGPSETVVGCSSYEVEWGEGGEQVGIGRPISNMRMYVLDGEGEPVPVGVEGELYIGGVGVARGYMGRAELTAERFVPDPYGEGERLYRSGDRGRYRETGEIEYLGRVDQQVKLRGYRIELGEIEEVLRGHSDVLDCAVLLREDPPGDKKLVAYIVKEKATALLQSGELRRYLQLKLPGYMVPGAFVPLKELPLTLNGKVNQEALPGLAEQLCDEESERIDPRTPVEEVLLEIWRQVLRYEQIGVFDNFFAIGGHSLSATQVIARIWAVLHVELPLRSLFEMPTVAAIAENIEATLSGGMARAIVPLVPVSRHQELPLSFAQQRLWFLHHLEPESPAYLITNAWQLLNILDVAVLERSLEELIFRHESLRTIFPERQGLPVQMIQPVAVFRLPVIELSALSSTRQEKEVKNLSLQESRNPCDLSQGPLLRIFLLRLGPRKHSLFVTMHHIITDGWSLQIFYQELWDTYRVLLADRPASLPPLPVQYVDFADWQRTWLQNEALEEQLTYWKRQLADVPTLELPTDHPRPPVQTLRGAHQRRLFSSALYEKLVALSRREGVTLFMTLLAAFQVLLARYTQQTDMSVGTPVANRTRPEFQSLIGCFINTLVMRTDLSGNPTFVEILSRVREVALGAYTHQEIPFERLVETLMPVRDQSRSPLFQVFFGLQQQFTLSEQIENLAIHELETEHDTTKFDLSLFVFLGGVEQSYGIEYNADLFEDSTISRLLEHWENLLNVIVVDPQSRMSDIPLLSQWERTQLLEEWNATEVEREPEWGVHQLFEQQVERSADAIAMVANGEQVSYGWLNARANQLARELQGLGVGPEEVVGIALERSIWLSVGLLGVLKAGGAYLPLDPSTPCERQQYMLQTAGARLVLTVERLREEMEEVVGRGAGERVVALDRAWEAGLQEQAADNLAGYVSGEQLAYVIYTSGSTGQPKGAMNTHRGLCNRLLWGQETYQLTSADRVLQKTPISFDVSVWELLWAVMAGGRVVMAEPGGQRDAGYLREVIEREGITVVHFVPSLLQAFLQEEDLGGCQGVRAVICSGEALSPVLRQRCLARLGGELHNLYGPTEAAIEVTWWACERGDEREVVPIGRPISNMRMYVLDGSGEPVPVGVEGELYMGGVGVARGYMGRAELTAERFVPDPYGVGGRLYRSGDRVRYGEGGELAYVGRVDQQVKLRGYRIELGEIEEGLREQVGVLDCAVVVQEVTAGTHRLVAYVVSEPGEGVGEEEWRAGLQQRLPEYMVPGVYVRLAGLPLTASGKVDRRGLPEVERGGGAGELGKGGARTREESVLVEIWSEVLGLAPEEIGVRDNFFGLGGDSILSIQVVSRARQRGLELTVRQVFQGQTIERLAEGLRLREPEGEEEEEEEEEEGAVIPLTPIQEWFFGQRLARRGHFNQAVVLQVPEGVRAERVEEGLQGLVERHGSLRLRYAETEEGGWKQWVGAAGEVKLQRVSLAGLGERERAREMERCGEEVQGSLDLGLGRLVGGCWVELGEGRGVRLVLVIHHLGIDGVSWRILLEELREWCRVGSGVVAWGRRTGRYGTWARSQVEWARSAEVREEEAYWVRQGVGRRLRVEGAGGVNRVGTSRTCVLRLGKEQTRALLQEVPKAYRSQIQEVLLTGLARSVQRWQGVGGGVQVWVEGHGREEELGVEVSRTVGWFTTLYPVRLEVSGGEALGDLKRVREALARVPRGGSGYGQLRYLAEEESVREALAGVGAAEVVFNYLGQTDQSVGEGWGWGSEGSGRSSAGENERGFVWEVTARVQGGQVVVEWTYSEQLHREETIGRLMREYEEEVEGLIEQSLLHGGGGGIPADYPLVRVSQEEVEGLEERYGEVERIYPLSGVQQGLVFHTLYEPGSGAYVEQVRWQLAGGQVQAQERAWRRVQRECEVLRLAVVWDGRGGYEQVVVREVGAGWLRVVDGRGLLRDTRERERKRLREQERERGFGLEEVPLMRVWVQRWEESEEEVLWSYHHVVLDGWSVPLVMGTWLAGYAAYREGREPERSVGRRGYGDYIGWLQEQSFEGAEEYWRGQVGGRAGGTPLPGEQVGESKQGERWGEVRGELGVEASGLVLRKLREEGVTLNSALQGSWAVVLSRYSGEREVVFGATVAGREGGLEGIEEMVGMFINTLAVVVRVEGEREVWEWLREVQEEQRESRRYETTPLVRVQEWSGWAGGGRELFESVLVVENYPVEAGLRERMEALGIREVEVEEQTHYGLTLRVSVVEGQVRYAVLYDGWRVSREGVERVLEQWQRVLRLLVEEGRRRVRELQVLSAQERQQLLVTWNPPPYEERTPACLHELFEEQAIRRPDAIAVVCGDEQLSYEQLNTRANQLARFLQHRGLEPEEMVGIALERSPFLITGLLAILKAGGVYVPLDPFYPVDRLEFMITDAHVSVLLTQQSLIERLPGYEIQIVCLDRDWSMIGGGPGNNLSQKVIAQQLAYVIYTSGSTGRPKGVMVNHANVTQLFVATQPDYQFHDQDTWTLFHSYAFDFSVWEIWGALLYGGRLVIVSHEERLGPERFLVLLQEQQVTVLNQTPSAFQQLIQIENETQTNSQLALRLVIFGGEALDQRRLWPWLERHGEQEHKMINMYGITETTVHVTYYPFKVRDAFIASGSIIGRPLSSLQVYVLDQDMQPAPVGAGGQIYVGGLGIARGYLNQPELTAERFIPHPFSERAGARLYKTGDLARFLSDGALEYLGRIDQQVKIRGFRIELGEIETVLRQHPGIQRCVVLLQPDGKGVQRLVAYVIAHQDESPGSGELRKFLLKTVPDYMVPAFFMLMEEFPLTPNGKLDRQALPQPGSIRPDLAEALVQPETATEELVTRIWGSILGVERIGIHDNFFDLGGHSLHLLRTQKDLERQFHKKIAISDLFAYPTIALLARYIEQNDVRTVQPVNHERFRGRRLAMQKQRAGRQQHRLEENTEREHR